MMLVVAMMLLIRRRFPVLVCLFGWLLAEIMPRLFPGHGPAIEHLSPSSNDKEWRAVRRSRAPAHRHEDAAKVVGSSPAFFAGSGWKGYAFVACC